MEKLQKETVISKVFIDVKSTPTRQTPFINALFVRRMMPELWCAERRIVEPDLPHKGHSTVKLDFVDFFFPPQGWWVAGTNGRLFATGERQ